MPSFPTVGLDGHPLRSVLKAGALGPARIVRAGPFNPSSRFAFARASALRALASALWRFFGAFRHVGSYCDAVPSPSILTRPRPQASNR
jgi:hypothetical protein